MQRGLQQTTGRAITRPAFIAVSSAQRIAQPYRYFIADLLIKVCFKTGAVEGYRGKNRFLLVISCGDIVLGSAVSSGQGDIIILQSSRTKNLAKTVVSLLFFR